jgi:putative ABC transport system permease protein
MSLGSRLRRLRGSFRNNAFEESMEAELRHHLELEAEMLAARGMSTGEARDLACRRFGSVSQVKDECRDSCGQRAIDACSQDAHDALRGVRKHPAYAAVVTLTLALGIGAATAIFSVVYAVLMQPLPYAHG